MTPSDVIAEPAVTEISPEEMLRRLKSVEDLQRRNALLSGLCDRILDWIAENHYYKTTQYQTTGKLRYDRWRKELDQLSGEK